MGTLCDKTQSSSIDSAPATVKEVEKEISIPSFSSLPDDIVKGVEEKFMFLRDIHFLDYVFLLSKFSMENATIEDNLAEMPNSYSCHDAFFNEDLSEDAFQVFIEKKIIKHKALYEKLSQDEGKCSKFKDIMAKFYKKLNSKLSKAKEGFVFKKWHALLFGFVYCKGENVSKIKFLFNLFAEESKFGKSSDFSDFQEALYLTCSYCTIAVRVELVESYSEDFPAVPQDELKKLLDACQQKDCQNLVTVTDNRFFGEDGRKEYFVEEFKTLFNKSNKEECLGFILSAKGIRYLMEKNNV